MPGSDNRLIPRDIYVPPGGPQSVTTDIVLKQPDQAQVVGNADPGIRVGVYGKSNENIGVYGQSETWHGVWADTNNAQRHALVARNLQPDGFAGLFEGHVHVTGTVRVDKDVVLTNGDCAEDFDVNALAIAEPGTVMAFDTEGRLIEAVHEYDSRVAGIVAGAGHFKPAMILDRRPSSGPRAPIALMGKVFCKVDADFEPIQAGDLLTSSRTAGHAMRVSDLHRAYGAVVGKALRSLGKGRGLIPVLVQR